MKLYQNLLADFEETYYAYMTAGIIISSCVGSIAAMMILMKGHALVNMVELFFVVIVCMGYNATVLAQLKPKHVLNALLLSIVVSTVLIAVNVPL
ncbi:hypothetical protein RM545_09720 [Zunongwangia sp. F260]|uniref:Uncharacterized protein n=1 Tax=Autumnicola lenta TaxID=3075593 RepID=A0ABU3CKT7_9FLAO|nr:hypothetical protein [Zunongwangia sp. F260]MDT0646969.1 hypothetical protein [Zunongwangia sp. F260]